MAKNLLDELKSLLQKDERLVSEDKLLKNKIIELAIALDKDLLELLLSHSKIKKTFFTQVGKTTIFNKDKFIKFISNKQFLPDSYTAFKNKIGLTENDEYISEKKEVVLSWPYKDCVLGGGQTKEEAKREEIFWNQTLAPDEISRLLEPKVFTNAKRVDKKGEREFDKFTTDEKGSIKDNLIIKGNNLLALHSLKERFAGKVKLVYIDPPYNTGNDSFGYNNRFNHSSWLTFMKNRLEVARELLSKDGSIWMNIDDDEGHYLKVLADGVFGRENFVANVVWQKKYTIANDARYFSDNHDHILVIARNKEYFKLNGVERTEEQNARYSNPDNDPRGPWMSQPLHAKSGNAEKFKYKFENGIEWSPPRGTYPRYTKENLRKFEEEGKIWFGADGKAVPRLKKYLKDMGDITPATLWFHNEVGNNDQANRELKKLIDDDIFDTPKPEKLLKRIIHIGSGEKDIVLDFFSGSGTTGAVAHKMKRQYILIEQLEEHIEILQERLKKVIAGEQGGISKEVSWKGGGDFIYMELAKWNENFIEQIKKAKTSKELEKLWKTLKEKAYLSYKVDIATFDNSVKEFSNLSLANQKRFLLETLDQNHLYINYSEIDDNNYKVDKESRKMNKEFYSK
jgi:adenine-specific DNA-methyltransferase